MTSYSMVHVATLLEIIQIVASYHVSSTHKLHQRRTILFSNSNPSQEVIFDHATLSPNDIWEDHYYKSQSAYLGIGDDDNNERWYRSPSHSYISKLLRDMNAEELDAFILEHENSQSPTSAIRGNKKSYTSEKSSGKRDRTPDTYIDEPHRHIRLLRRRLPDPLWSQIRLEATNALSVEPDAGPQLYQHVLSRPSLIDALASIISHEIETELMPATSLQSLILDQLHLSDDKNIHLDVVASVNRNPSADSTALNALLFHQGMHALVCYRVAHQLWQAGRTGLAMYMQSTVSVKYAADIHPAADIAGGTYLNVGGGVVIGETAKVGRDVTILQGVTLGGTGKETGDRHPKVESGVILHCGATVLGNINVGRGSVVTAKSIVTKPVPALARVSGVPATVKSYRELSEEGYQDDEEEDCPMDDLDCQISKLYEQYFVELDALMKIEECIASGNDNCWDSATDLLNSDT